MGTLIRRLLGLTTAVVLTAGIAACGADATSPVDTGPTNITPNGTTITVDSGIDAQAAVAGSTITVFVRVKTATGAPIPGDTVTWNVATGGGSIPSTTSVTDANGIASTPWTIGIIIGANTLGANITGAAVPINATGTVGPLALLTKISPDSQNVAATGTVLLTARTTDVNGNPIDSVNVAWTTTGGSISATTALSGTSGNSGVNFTTATGVARYTVTATAPGIAPVSFIVKTF